MEELNFEKWDAEDWFRGADPEPDHIEDMNDMELEEFAAFGVEYLRETEEVDLDFLDTREYLRELRTKLRE